MINANINISSIKDVSKRLNNVASKLSKQVSNEVKQKTNEALYNEWHKKERVEIFKTAGRNINKPFPRTKKNDIRYRKKRRYPVQLGFTQGIYSGASYYVLQKQQSVSERKFYKRVSSSSIIIRVSGKGSKYYNFTLGISDKLIEKYRKKIIKETEAILNETK